MSSDHNNPFARGINPWTGEPTITMNADDRRALVRSFTYDQCERALQVEGLQATVRQAVERRMRAIEKAERQA